MVTRIERRLEKINWDALRSAGLSDSIYVGGGAFLKNWNDIDIYPTLRGQFECLCFNDNFHRIIAETPNAITVEDIGSGIVLQFCNYYHPSLISLVNSFDYAHCQIGALINTAGRVISDIYHTSDFTAAMTQEGTWYTGSAYPLSSLFRAFKYHNRGRLVGRKLTLTIVNTIIDITKRGFTDWKDFKDQLDAVDLGLLPEDYDNCGDTLKRLYDLLQKKQ